MEKVRSTNKNHERLIAVGVILGFLVSFPSLTFGQDFPTKPITIQVSLDEVPLTPCVKITRKALLKSSGERFFQKV